MSYDMAEHKNRVTTHLAAVVKELNRQILKWGVQDRTPLEWHVILAEEFGEVAKEVNEVHFRYKGREELRKELIQVAAVCIATLENMDRRGE